MRKHASLLAVLLVFVLISAPISASACDLSCWLDRSDSDCHSVSSQNQDHSMAMNADMNMDPGMNMDADSSAETNAAVVPAQTAMNHTMFKLDFARNPVERDAQFVSGPKMPFGNLTSCAEGACSQISLFSSPPHPGTVLAHVLGWTAIGFSAPPVLASLGVTIESSPSPPKLSSDHPLPLRI